MTHALTDPMTPPSARDATAASLPLSALPLLAGLRDRPDVRLKPLADRLWVFWPPGEDDVTLALQAILGAELFCKRDGLWYRPGQHLPAFNVPGEDGAFSLPALLAPAPISPELSSAPFWQKIGLSLVRDERPRPSSALLCGLKDLERWVSLATAHQLAALQAAWNEDSAFLLGNPLPASVPGQRYWGRDVLVPIGLRLEPLLSEVVVRAALGLQPDEVALFPPPSASALGAPERIPRSAFGPLTRAGVRLAMTRPQNP
jgi:hypothetical protein